MPHALALGLDVARRLAAVVVDTFLNPASVFSLLSLGCALVLAVSVTAARRLRRRGRVSLRLLERALRPRRAATGPSGRADLGFFLLNTFATGLLIGGAIVSQAAVSGGVAHGLDRLAGGSRLRLAGWQASALATTALFVASDLGYWLDHWLSHRISWLWEIHKVHHAAEGLTPLTVWRVHPLESLKFYNVLALTTGLTDGVLRHMLGPVGKLHLLGVDALWMAFALTVLHLQHSHVWISFPGRLGKILMSPAHHQVHHSAEPRHHGKNLGNVLAVWDWMAGRLHVPSAERERFAYGLGEGGAEAHSVTGSLITPMVEAGRALARDLAHLAPGRPIRRPVDIRAPVA